MIPQTMVDRLGLRGPYEVARQLVDGIDADTGQVLPDAPGYPSAGTRDRAMHVVHTVVDQIAPAFSHAGSALLANGVPLTAYQELIAGLDKAVDDTTVLLYTFDHNPPADGETVDLGLGRIRRELAALLQLIDNSEPTPTSLRVRQHMKISPCNRFLAIRRYPNHLHQWAVLPLHGTYPEGTGLSSHAKDGQLTDWHPLVGLADVLDLPAIVGHIGTEALMESIKYTSMLPPGTDHTEDIA